MSLYEQLSNIENKKLFADMLILSAQKRDSDNQQLSDIRYICDCENINIYHVSKSIQCIIIELYADYISKADNERYTASMYFRISESELNTTHNHFIYYEIDFMCMLDEH